MLFHRCLLTYVISSDGFHESASRESWRDHNIMCEAALCQCHRRGWDGCVRVKCYSNVLCVIVIS